MKVAIIGAASESFGPTSLRDLFVSKVLAAQPLEICLMDLDPQRLKPVVEYGAYLNDKLQRKVAVSGTTTLEDALRGCQFAICAIEVKRMLYWAMDYHVPRQFGFQQPYGENGGIGGIFHALRNIPPMMHIAHTMARVAPGAWLLNYTNPEHKLCEALTRLTDVPTVGLCHGVGMGRRQISQLTGVPDEHLEAWACGINHLTFFESVRDRRTGADLYPVLRRLDAEGHELAHWYEIALGRVLFRRLGLWPSPAANHYGEYIRWGHEFVIDQPQFYYDPARGAPWQTGRVPQLIYEPSDHALRRPWHRDEPPAPALSAAPIAFSGEFGVPIIESIGCGHAQTIDAVNMPNRGYIPNLPDEAVVEVPADAGQDGLKPRQMAPLPEGIAALIRTQLSIHRLIVEAYAEKSRDKLLQAVLLEPTVDSYHRAVAMLDRMLELQKQILPELR